MSGNSFGQLFRVTTFGESHGGCVGAVVDGCPPGLALSESDIQPDLDRRRPGQANKPGATKRDEKDRIKILSGVFEGRTTGMPIMMMAVNEDQRPEDYEAMKRLYRPSHADYTFSAKYGIRDFRGSGRASARETLGRVAAGAIAKKYLAERLGVQFLAFVEQIGCIVAQVNLDEVTLEQIAASDVCCPDPICSERMIGFIYGLSTALGPNQRKDSAGGVIRGIIRGVPVGLGEPVFDKLHADLAKAMVSINAVKGFEIGSGFAGVAMRGSEHNDPFVVRDGRIRTITNNSGGVQGGISNGEDIVFRVAFKPVATIRGIEQQTVDTDGNTATLTLPADQGRHDACVVPRAVPIVEAMAALTIMDHYLRYRGQIDRR